MTITVHDRATGQALVAAYRKAGRTLAIIARSGSARAYKAVCELIERYYDFRDFVMVNGALCHKTEV